MKLVKYKIRGGTLVLGMISDQYQQPDFGPKPPKEPEPVELPKSSSNDKSLFDQLNPALDNYEKLRKKAFRNSILSFTLSSIIGLILIVILFQSQAEIALKLFLTSLTLMFVFIISNISSRKFKGKYKSDLLQIIFSEFGIQAQIKAYKNIGGKHIEDSGLFSFTNSYRGEDRIEGFYRDHEFIFSEVQAGHEKGSGDNKRTINKFTGLFYFAQLKYNFNSSVTINTKDFRFKKDPPLPMGDFESLHPEFDIHFNVNYTDYDEASHLLSQEFMEALIAFKIKHKYPFAMRIINNRLYLAINENYNFFNISIFDEVNSLRKFRILYKDTLFFVNLIHTLDKIQKL